MVYLLLLRKSTNIPKHTLVTIFQTLLINLDDLAVFLEAIFRLHIFIYRVGQDGDISVCYHCVDHISTKMLRKYLFSGKNSTSQTSPSTSENTVTHPLYLTLFHVVQIIQRALTSASPFLWHHSFATVFMFLSLGMYYHKTLCASGILQLGLVEEDKVFYVTVNIREQI